jgi:D-alanyl-D-alanine dipeptidase
MLNVITNVVEAGELVDVQKLEPTIRKEVRYATADNFMKEVLYQDDRCFLLPEVAERLVRAHRELQKQGFGIKVYDCYRPLAVQKKMFARFPMPGYVANPAKGSNHNRGAAVDCTIVDANGNERPMPSDYDEFSERAHPSYTGGTAEQRQNRDLLRRVMLDQGFTPISMEWWHFDAPNAGSYPVLDIPSQDLP